MDDGKDGLDYRSNCGEGLSTSRERSKQSWARGIVSREAEEESSRVWKGDSGREEAEADERWRVRCTGVIIKKIDSLREAAAGEMGRLISFAVGTRSFAPCQARGA
jgi:hypothetical protein